MNIHDRAQQLMRESYGKLTLTEAYRELSRRSAEQRRRRTGRAHQGVLHVTNSDRAAVKQIEQPAYWWQKETD